MATRYFVTNLSIDYKYECMSRSEALWLMREIKKRGSDSRLEIVTEPDTNNEVSTGML